MLDFIGTIVITAVAVVGINAVVSNLPVSRAQRIAAALAVGLWVGLAAASASAGMFAVASAVPAIGFFVLFPPAAVATLVTLSPAWRAALLALPTPLLIGLNIPRVFGVFFLLLVAAGRLGGPFPYSAGWGDIATGAFAIPALFLILQPAPNFALLKAWNLFGALDLIIAIVLGVTSAPNSPLQLFDAGAGATAMQALPWAFVPTVLVPFYLIVHGVLFAQLRQSARITDGRRDYAVSAA